MSVVKRQAKAQQQAVVDRWAQSSCCSQSTCALPCMHANPASSALAFVCPSLLASTTPTQNPTPTQQHTPGYAGMADLIVEWGELVDMPIALTLAGGSGGASAAGAAGAGGSGGSFSRAYSGLHRGPLAASGSVLSAVVGDGSAAGGLAGGDGGAHLDVLLLQVRACVCARRFVRCISLIYLCG